MSNKEPLEKELILGGATPTEARQLSELASRLPALRQVPELPPGLTVRHRQVQRRFLWHHWSAFTRFSLAAMALIIITGGLSTVAQSALPGDLLYPVKRGTESVAVSIRPKLHDQVMMNRAGEIQQLVASHRRPALIQATLASYDQAVKSNPAGSYAARDYCASLLRAAAKQADPTTRAQILSSLSRVPLDHT